MKNHYFQVHTHSSELNKVNKSSLHNGGGTKLKSRELKMVRTMIIVLCGFLFTTGPLAICCIVSFSHNERNLHFIMRGLVVMSTFNSILNPIFYFCRIPEMSNKLKKMLQELTSCCNNENMHQGSQSATYRRRFSSFQVRLHWIPGFYSAADANNKKNKKNRNNFDESSNSTQTNTNRNKVLQKSNECTLDEL